MLRSLLLFAVLSAAFMVHAQENLSSLTGKGRPYTSNPDSLARSLRKKCEEKITRRIGKKLFETIYDPSYLYPHYYKNVYYNTAEQERNYRVYFRTRLPENILYEFEIALKEDGQTLVFPISDFLPDCKNKLSRCHCAGEKEVLQKGDAMEPEWFHGSGHAKFGYDAKEETFIWTYQKLERVSSTKGHTLTVVFDANDLSIIRQQLDTNVWMGRCLGKGSMVKTPSGFRTIEELHIGDTVLARNSEQQREKYVVCKKVRRAVIAPFPILKMSTKEWTALISPAHPDENGLPAGIWMEKDSHPGVSTTLYDEDFTYDILSTAPDGGYFCGEVYLRSTIPAFQK